VLRLQLLRQALLRISGLRLLLRLLCLLHLLLRLSGLLGTLCTAAAVDQRAQAHGMLVQHVLQQSMHETVAVGAGSLSRGRRPPCLLLTLPLLGRKLALLLRQLRMPLLGALGEQLLQRALQAQADARQRRCGAARQRGAAHGA
jgi:hypothetical protein